MKLSHLTIIFIIIILPISIISRSKMEDYFLTLRDQVRLNNVIDAATQDAIDTLIEANNEFQSISTTGKFDVTQKLAKEAVQTFFKTFAINFNMPYIPGQTESYFSVYIPAIVVVAYDGFYIYSVDDTGNRNYAYQMSPKIPYSYTDEKTGAIINFTLGNHIKMLVKTDPDNDNSWKYLEGELTNDFIEDSSENFQKYIDAYQAYYENTPAGTSQALDALINDLPSLTSDLSVLIYALANKYEEKRAKIIPGFLVPGSSTNRDVPLLQDYGEEREASDFHKIRRKVIIELIRQTLQEEINSHETYAKIMGATYDFDLPEITDDDWTNSINDISVLSFVQGMKIGTSSYYNNYAFGGSRIVETDYLYGTTDSTGLKLYHKSSCELIKGFFETEDDISEEPLNSLADHVDNIFLNREHAASSYYWPCLDCDP